MTTTFADTCQLLGTWDELLDSYFDSKRGRFRILILATLQHSGSAAVAVTSLLNPIHHDRIPILGLLTLLN